MARKQKRDPLMVRVWAELGAGRIREAWIDDADDFVSGICEHTGHITINPAIDIVDSCLHEILHRLYPGWSEAYVKGKTTYLMRRMTDGEIQAFYSEYEKRVRHKRKGRLSA